MATISWLGGSGDWNAGALWSGAVVPGAGDVAAISAAGTYTVLLDGTDMVAGAVLGDAAATLTVSGALDLDGGTLAAQAGALTLSGTLTDGTLVPSGADIVLSGPAAALLGVTVRGTLDLSGSGASADVTDLGQSALTELKVGANTQLVFLDPEIFDGQTIAMAGGMLLTDGLDPNDGSLFFGPDTTLVQNAASTTAQIGADAATSLLGLGEVTNEGTMIAAAGTLDLDSQGGAFDSELHQGPFLNAGTIEIDAGAVVIDDTNSTLAGLGSILDNGGLLDLRGTLTNTNSTLDVAATGGFGDLQLDDTVVGGTIREAGGTLAIGAASLQGVTLLGTGVVFNTLTIGAGTQFDPGGAPYVLTAGAVGYGQIFLNNGAVLGNARIAYGGTQFQADLIAQGGSAPEVTLAASTTLDVGAGQILRLEAGQNGTLVDDAVINVAAGGRLEFGNAASYAAGGTINVAPGATVELNGGLDINGEQQAGLTGIGLAGLTDIVGSGATLVNTGSLSLEGQTISAAGDANFSRVVNEGEIANGTFVAAPGQDQALGQFDAGVTLATGPGVLPVSSVTLAGGVLRGAVQLNVNGTIAISGNTTLSSTSGVGPGTFVLNQQPTLFVNSVATSLQFDASATLANADVLLSGITGAQLSAALSAVPDINVNFGSTATFAPSTTIVASTVNGPFSGIGNQGFVVNDGTIAVLPGADFFVVPYGSSTQQDFFNHGRITIAAGGTFDVATQASIQSLGSIVGPGGLLRLDAPSFGVDTYVNTDNTLYVGGASGAPNLDLDSTSITGGTIVNAGGEFTAISGELVGVTYIGALDLAPSSNIFGAADNASLDFTGGTLDSQSVTLSAGADLALSMPQSFVGATLSLAGELSDSGEALSFDPSTVVTVTGAATVNAGHVLNAGTILIGPGASLDLSDASAASAPETSEPGTIAIDDGAFTSTALNSGQKVELGADSSFSVSRFDPGSDVVFQAPNTLTIDRGSMFGAGAVVSDFGVGDTILLGGYQDGLLAQEIYGNDGIPHFADPAITFGYDGETLDVIQSGSVTIEAIPIGAGYKVGGFSAAEIGDPPYTVSGYDITYAAPGATPPSPPTISGTQANQPTTDRVAIHPFGQVTITDPNAGAVDTAVITTLGTVPQGGVDFVGQSDTGTFSNIGIGTLISNGEGYIVSGTAAAVQAALDGLVFTPVEFQTAPGQTVTTGLTIALSDQIASATDTITSVAATAVEDPLLLSGVTPVLFVDNNVNAAQPFHDVVLSDPDDAVFTATATLASTQYLAFGDSFGATISPGGIWSASGSLSIVETALHNLVAYVNSEPALPSGQFATTAMTMSINDGGADTATAISTIDIVSSSSADAAGLQILGAGPGQAISDQTPIAAFANVAITDKQVGAPDTVTVVMSNPADGVFSDALGGTIDGGTFTVSGTPVSGNAGIVTAVNSVLEALIFTPVRGQVPLGQSVTTGFTITASNTLGSVTDASTSVIATDEGGQLSINGAQAGQEADDDTTLLPLAGVTITDTQAVPQDTVTVTLSNPAIGVLSAGEGGTVEPDGVFQISGERALVQAALQAVGFTPAAASLGSVENSGLTIDVTDGTLSATNTITSLAVIGTMPCFAAGTRIMTPHGEVPVELLREGDFVVTASGAPRPVRWIGHRRIDCRHHVRQHEVWPVRVQAGAFGPGLPRRELWLSPDHAVFIDAVLIPVRYLVNGRTIVQAPVSEVTYYHVELATHDVILAEHLPCESYLDTGNRSDFFDREGAELVMALTGVPELPVSVREMVG